jgi:regulator of replication initiation timing
MLTNQVPKTHIVFNCEKCLFKCSKKSEWERHLVTRKHNSLTILTGKTQKTPLHICTHCSKEYKSREGLWYHLKKCNENITMSISENSTSLHAILSDNEDFKKLILEVVKNNTELQKQNTDLQKQLVEVCKNTSNTNINSHNNSHNKTFNLQFFLNEQCKDAMNISEFADSFDLQLSDLESVGELGYVEGITKIFVDKLNSMDIYKRPIHCSDAKREILYVKDDNKWEREERNNPKIRYAIKTISFRNMKLANLWSDTYPESKDGDSHLNDTYMKLIKESTGGNGEISISEDKIIRRIAKEIIIDKCNK